MLESPFRLVARLPPAVRLLVLGSFVNKAGTFVVPFLTLVLRRDFGLTAAQVGALVLAYGIGSIVSVLTGGLLTDRLGRRLTLLVSLGGSGALAVAMGFAPSLTVFLPLLVLFGFLADLYRPAASSIISDLLPSIERAVGYAALRMAVNLGFAVGMALGGLLAEWSWRALFVGDGATTLLYGVVVWLFIPETRPAPAARPRAAPKREPGPWSDRVFLEVAFSSLVFSLVFFADITVLPLTVTMGAGYPATVYGLLIALNGLLIALFEVSVVSALRHCRRLRLAALGMLLTGAGMAVLGLRLSWPWFLSCVVVFTVGEMLASPQQMAFIADWAPPAARGRYLAMFQATWSLSFAVNPILFLPLHARLGDRAFWPVMVLLAVPAALLLLHLDRSADRPDRLRGHSTASETASLSAADTPAGSWGSG